MFDIQNDASIKIMIPEYYAIAGAIIASLGGIYYLYETITGKSQPNRVTWILWGIFPMITFAAQRAQGVEGISWVTFVSGFIPLLVFLTSFINKKAYWKSRPMDYYLMIAAIAGITMWALTDNANLAIAFALLADFLAAIPTIIKCFKHPESESWIAYSISTLGFILSLFAIQAWNFQTSAFVIYLTLINGLMAVLSARKPTTPALHTEVV